MTKKYLVRCNLRDPMSKSKIYWTDEEIIAITQGDAMKKIKLKYGSQFHSFEGVWEIKEAKQKSNKSSSEESSSTGSSTGGKAGCFTLILGIVAIYYIFTSVSSFLFYWDNIYILQNTVSYEKENFSGKTTKISFKEDDFIQVDMALITKNGEKKSIKVGLPLAKFISDVHKKEIGGSKQIASYELAPKYYEYMKYLKPMDIILPDSETYNQLIKSETRKYYLKNKNKFKEWNLDESSSK